MTALLDVPPTPTRAPAPEETPGVDVVHVVAGGGLHLNSRSANVICVVDGAIYVAFGYDEFILMPGDQLTIRAGERHRAWNPGGATASVVVGEMQRML